QVLADRCDQRGVADLPVARHDDLRLEALELFEHADPAAAVDVGVVGREVREDREEAVLDEVAREEHALLREKDDLVAAGVREAPRAELRPTVAEVEVRRAVVDDVRLDELDALELRRDTLAERPEQLGVAPSLLVELGELP